MISKTSKILLISLLFIGASIQQEAAKTQTALKTTPSQPTQKTQDVKTVNQPSPLIRKTSHKPQDGPSPNAKLAQVNANLVLSIIMELQPIVLDVMRFTV